MVGMRRERAVQADHVTAGQQLGQGHVLHAHGHTRRVGRGVCRQQCATKTGHQPAKGFTNTAGAHHAHGAAMHVKPQQASEREVAFAHTGVGAVDLAVQGKQQGQRVLGHGIRRILGNAAYGHA